MKNSAYILLSVLTLLSLGCTTTKQPPMSDLVEVSLPMITTRAGNETSISWDSEIEKTYTVYYTEIPAGKKPEWIPLEQGQNVHGTGEQITVRDKAEKNLPRRYTLRDK